MGMGALIGAGTNLIGGWLANKQAKRQQDHANQLRQQAMGYMQGANNFDPMATAQGQAMRDTANLSLGDYRMNLQNSLANQYGQRGLMGSSMAVSSMQPGLEDAFHRQRLDSQNQIGDYIQRMRAAKFGEAGQMAGMLTGQAGVFDQQAAQSGQEALQGFQGAGSAIGGYLANRWAQHAGGGLGGVEIPASVGLATPYIGDPETDGISPMDLSSLTLDPRYALAPRRGGISPHIYRRTSPDRLVIDPRKAW